MTIDINLIVTEEVTKQKWDIYNGIGTPSIEYLDELRTASSPLVFEIIDDVYNVLGLNSELSNKSPRTAEEKCLRPETLRKYPWFNLSHIRDYLRFRTYLNKGSDFEKIIRYFELLQDRKRISIVKIDTAKLVNPGIFGWRMIAVDIRVSETGMLVEHYMAFRDMIEVNELWLHKVYEKWRSAADPDELTSDQRRNLNRDALFSSHAYRELLFDGIIRDLPPGSDVRERRKMSQQSVINSLTSALNLR